MGNQTTEYTEYTEGDSNREYIGKQELRIILPAFRVFRGFRGSLFPSQGICVLISAEIFGSSRFFGVMRVAPVSITASTFSPLSLATAVFTAR